MTFFSGPPKPTAVPQPITYSSSSISTPGPFTHVTFPAIRRVSPGLISQQIVSTQPMSMPGTTRYPCRSQEHFNQLWALSEKFNEMYPVGSIVNKDSRKDYNGILSWIDFTYGSPNVKQRQSDATITQMSVRSEAFVLAGSSSVGFLTDRSLNDSDFFFLDQFVEYEFVIKGVSDKDVE